MLGKALTDPVWFFITDWFAIYLVSKGFRITHVGPDGTVWVTDPSGDRVLLFDREGRPLGVARHAAPLATPLGIAVVDATHAVVSNAGSYSLAVVWRTSSTSVEPER